MSRAPTASALISTFVRDIPHSLLVLHHDFIGQRERRALGQRWPASTTMFAPVIHDARAESRPR